MIMVTEWMWKEAAWPILRYYPNDSPKGP